MRIFISKNNVLIMLSCFIYLFTFFTLKLYHLLVGILANFFRIKIKKESLQFVVRFITLSYTLPNVLFWQ